MSDSLKNNSGKKKYYNKEKKNLFDDFILKDGSDLMTSLRISYSTKKQLETLNVEGSTHEQKIKNLILETKQLQEIVSKYEDLFKKNNFNFSIKFLHADRRKEIIEFLNIFKVTYSYNPYNKNDDEFLFNIKLENVTLQGKKVPFQDLYLAIGSSYSQGDYLEEFDEKISIFGEMIVYFTILRKILLENNIRVQKKLSKKYVLVPKYWLYYFSNNLPTNTSKKRDLELKVQKYDLKLKEAQDV